MLNKVTEDEVNRNLKFYVLRFLLFFIKKEFLSFIFLIVILLSFRSMFFEPFRIPSGSMIPTLKIGDFILVNKMSYGIKFPLWDTFSHRSAPILYRGKSDVVRRGDVIVFKFPKNPNVNYIKRVIALPGDKLKILEKKVYINGKMIEIKKIDSLKANGEEEEDPRYRESNFDFFQAMIDGKLFYYQLDKDNYFKVDYDEVTVPPDHYFVLGDNRDFSNDSRYWGFVPRSYIKGKAMKIWLSIGRGLKGNNRYFFRTERFGREIE